MPAVITTEASSSDSLNYTSSSAAEKQETGEGNGEDLPLEKLLLNGVVSFFKNENFHAILGGVVGFWGGVFGMGVVFLLLVAFRRHRKKVDEEARNPSVCHEEVVDGEHVDASLCNGDIEEQQEGQQQPQDQRPKNDPSSSATDKAMMLQQRNLDLKAEKGGGKPTTEMVDLSNIADKTVKKQSTS